MTTTTRTTRPPRLVWAHWSWQHDRPAIGDTVYLIATDDLNTSAPEQLWAQHMPGRTNQSREVRVNGWLGTTNNIHRSARGRGRIVQVRGSQASDGWRVQVRAMDEGE